MRNSRGILRIIVFAGLVIATGRLAIGQEGWKVETGKVFHSAMVKDFYLEGNAIPAEERNSALVKAPSGARTLVGLIDTTGYSSQIKQKYIGMLITEGGVSLCGQSVGVGSYGFGLDRPAASSNAEAKFHLYDQSGKEVASCGAPKDTELKMPKPLQVVIASDGTPWLYISRYRLGLKP